MQLYAKRLDHGRFIWPAPKDGAVAISAAQLGYLLEGLRLETLDSGVAVTAIYPGFIKTEMTAINKFSMPFLLEV